MAVEAVSDTGPLIHLSQIEKLELLKIVDRLLIPLEVKDEFRKGGSLKKLRELDIIEVKEVKGTHADSAGAMSRKFGLDLGEAGAIVLAKKKGISLIFTDDLDARRAAMMRGLEPHGSIGILLRAYRDGIISEEETITAIRQLHSDSSLYLTSDLTKRAVEAVREFSEAE
ncbi:hypothetical protein AKJ37_07870 [candidate division MSBL1 archaeon SCGC-AAA259I09]|uniref:Uncharacterized protein n=2 Tax=candidate division MSBL1 TaxID=215777 RepID=A0A133UIW0_9EURY|nr:hypothetical protein AKJ37_07870 [candidate division MSBL1 archaeon SCGC-AAA259I09]KXA95092.1 hypothetical protein AKJ36_01535 [candidate division MSBL1 archaeon SCGC-AAA259I07]